MAETRLCFVIAADPPNRLDKALSRDVPEAAALSRSRLARLLAEGAVRVNDALAENPKARVAEGDRIEITLEEASESHIGPEDIPLTVIHEDADLIVIDKPAGLVVHPAPGTPQGTLVNALLHHCGATLSGVGGVARPGIVHRIDKDTSGLLVVAKSDRAHQGLAAQFEKHTVIRHYLAIAHGVPDASDPRLRGIRGVSFEPGNIMKITSDLARHKHDRQRQAVLFGGGRHAVTRARVLESFGTPPALSLVECWLETGRTHQIRVHMAHAGHGLVGDPVYGGRRKLPLRALPPAGLTAARDFPRQALHAATLGFVHPVSGESMQFASPLPADMAGLIAALRGTEGASNALDEK
ncbi:RluA family pseudouridine synthase [Aquicoccus porphyridii]|uniref:RluA family pseudouridine synthase n=1 Tax=Aquicoccus porphyridii TaxID=1852029 RepID=UPI00273DB478|nr:RluA family pseudouridine synthase [Aquicoccus porphyridii]